MQNQRKSLLLVIIDKNSIDLVNFILKNKILKVEDNMKYNKIFHGIFISRPNRFIANVEIDGDIEKVHVKNTGRCKELLLPGAKVILEKSDNPNRKTKYDLVSVYKENFGLVNLDSQAPNKVVYEWLKTQNCQYIKPEYRYGKSRLDFYFIKDDKEYLMEVKGCTLEIEGIGYFPDAPTKRGVKHIKELISALEKGFHSILAFVIQMEGIEEVRPNINTHPEFAEVCLQAEACGVEIVFFLCKVDETGLKIIDFKYK